MNTPYYFYKHPSDPSALEISFDEWCNIQEDIAEERVNERLENSKNNDVNHENIQ